MQCAKQWKAIFVGRDLFSRGAGDMSPSLIARYAHKTKWKNKEFFALHLQFTPIGNQPLKCNYFGK